MKRFAFAAMALAAAIAPLQAQVPADFTDAAILPGVWTYVPVTGGSEARFVDSTGTIRMLFGCGRVTRLVTLSRISAAPAATLSFWTSSSSRNIAARFDEPSQRVITQLNGADPLLDAIAFSRGRFAVSMPGAPALVLPAGTEIAHVIEDCRG